MELDYNLISIIDILGVVQGVLFGTILLWMHSKKHKPTLYLGLFILLFSLEPIPNILQDLGVLNQYPQLELFPAHFHFMAFPLFYIYIQRISIFNGEDPNYKVLIPGIVEVISGLIIFLLPITTKLYLKDSYYSLVYFILGLSYSIFIGVLTIRWIVRHQTEINNQFSQTLHKNLNWAKLFVYVSIGFQLLVLANYFFNNYLWYLFVTVINVILIYWVSFKGITQENVSSLIINFTSGSVYKETPDQPKQLNTSNILQKKAAFITTKEMEDVINIVEDYIVNSQCFLKDNLTIIDIAEATNIHPKRISYSLNNLEQSNFNNYINKFRVQKAKELLKDDAATNLSIEGIGMEAGFHSKATFYSAFKKFEGCTPANYRSTLPSKLV